MTTSETLFYEALSVGMLNIVFNMVGKRLFPNSIVAQAIASGFIFHYVAEYSGLNEYYVKTKLPFKDDGIIKLDTSRLKRCLESTSSTEDCYSLALVLEYSDTTTQ